jgi:RNA polymerase-binding transcription factor DksA
MTNKEERAKEKMRSHVESIFKQFKDVVDATVFENLDHDQIIRIERLFKSLKKNHKKYSNFRMGHCPHCGQPVDRT